MKTLSIAFMVCLSGIISAQQLNNEGLYIGNEGDLFSGIVRSNKDGIRCEMHVKDGVLSGVASYFFASGKLMETGEFVNGQKENKWTRYNENGNIIAAGYYLSGRKNGTWLVFDDSGRKRFEMNYLNGEKNGTWTQWDENGVVMNTKNFTSPN